MTGPLMHPGFAAEMAKRQSTQTCTIQVVTETQSSSGEPALTWADLAGHTDLPCMVGPAGGGESKVMALTLGIQMGQVLILGYYPVITQKHRVMIDSIAYDILLRDIDQGRGLTRLTTKRVT